MSSPLDALRERLNSKPGAYEDMPFGPDALVFKVKGKMFALVSWRTDPLRISLKCDPFEAEALREEFDSIGPGYHLNKRHWNTVILDGSVPDFLVQHLIDQSHMLVVSRLKRSEQASLLNRTRNRP